VDVGTLRNWEQGRREPTGPAKALLTAISKDPTHVLKALAGVGVWDSARHRVAKVGVRRKGGIPPLIAFDRRRYPDIRRPLERRATTQRTKSPPRAESGPFFPARLRPVAKLARGKPCRPAQLETCAPHLFCPAPERSLLATEPAKSLIHGAHELACSLLCVRTRAANHGYDQTR